MMQGRDVPETGEGSRGVPPPPLTYEDALRLSSDGQMPLPITHHRADSRYRSLFENNLDPVFSLDRHGRIIEANPAAERMSGYAQNELRSLTFADLCAVEDRHKAMFFFARAIGGTPRSVELMAVCRDGSCVDLFITGAPILADGVVTGLFCIARDVTRKRRADEQLRRSRREAEQAKDRFLAVISHELRTPLMPVLTTVQMLERRADLPADLQEMLAMMRRNLELEARLIDDLLDLNRIRQGKLTLAYSNVDVHSKVRHVVDLCRSEIAEKRLNLQLDLAATESHVAADPARMQQIVWNLLSNAVKFTPAEGTIRVRTCNGARTANSCTGDCGGGKPTCRRCSPTLPQGQFIGIHICDTGVGIAPEAMQSLFDAFGRDEREGRHSSGKGIGLAVTRALVELHGGQLIVHSHGRGKGSTFSVILPLRNVCMLATDHHHSSKGTHPAAAGRRVLLVEDHTDTAKALSRLLADSGLKVTVASCVGEAKQACDGGTFDLLLSDIGLPDGSGLDVIRYARRKASIPAIALSGFGMDDDVRRSRDAGFSDHLVKPINIAQLQRTIRRLLAVC